MTNALLTEHLRNTLQHEGYVLLRGFFSPDDVSQMQAWIEEIRQWPSGRGPHLNYYEYVDGNKVIGRTEHFLPFHESFNSLIRSRVFPIVEQLFGEPILLFKEKINYKYPGTGKYNPHQDIHAADRSPLAFQPYHLNFVAFLDDASEENGCLEVVPGNFEGRELDKNPDGSLKQEVSDQLKYIPLVTIAGDALVLDTWIPHKSEKNTSAGPRRTLFLTFNAVSKGDFREEHFRDRAYSYGQTREISPDLVVERMTEEE